MFSSSKKITPSADPFASEEAEYHPEVENQQVENVQDERIGPLEVLKHSLKAVLVTHKFLINPKLIDNLPLVLPENTVANKQFLRAVVAHLYDDYTSLSVREDEFVSGPEFIIPSIKSELFEHFLVRVIAVPSIGYADRRTLIDAFVFDHTYSHINAVQFRDSLVSFLCKVQLKDSTGGFMNHREFFSFLRCLDADAQKIYLTNKRVGVDNEPFIRFPMDDHNNHKENAKHLGLINIPNTSMAFRSALVRHLNINVKGIWKQNRVNFYTKLNNIVFHKNCTDFSQISNITPLFLGDLIQLSDPKSEFVYVESVEKMEYFYTMGGYCYIPKTTFHCMSYWAEADIPVNYYNRHEQVKHLHDMSAKLETELGGLEFMLGMGAIAFGLTLSVIQIIAQILHSNQKSAKETLGAFSLVISILLTGFSGFLKFLMNQRQTDLAKVDASLLQIEAMDFDEDKNGPKQNNDDHV